MTAKQSRDAVQAAAGHKPAGGWLYVGDTVYHGEDTVTEWTVTHEIREYGRYVFRIENGLNGRTAPIDYLYQ